MVNNISTATLIAQLEQEMTKLNYSQKAREAYRAGWNNLMQYTAHKGLSENYSIALGEQFLKDRFGYDNGTKLAELSHTARNAVRTIFVLSHFYLHGVIPSRRLAGEPSITLCNNYQNILQEFQAKCVQMNYSKASIAARMSVIRSFLEYIQLIGITEINDVTGKVISDYVTTLAGMSSKTITTRLSYLRTFYRFLYEKEYHPKDLCTVAPRIKYKGTTNLPHLWKDDDIKKLLAAIDRGNPVGKRDFAIILLVIKTGIRASDVKNLKLKDIKWERKTIEFVQQKTGNPICLPLLPDVGWAIIEYIKNGRPKISSEYLFLRSNAPFSDFNRVGANFYNIISKYIRIAKLKLDTGRMQGLHSLRHAFVTKLIEAKTPMNLVVELAGHDDPHSAKIYSHLNIEQLRSCCLDPDEVAAYV